jgi:hypothetical protein
VEEGNSGEIDPVMDLIIMVLLVMEHLMKHNPVMKWNVQVS